MGPVARELLGEPNGALSTKVELRFGNRGSLSVRLDKGTWCDHENGGHGGGVLDLVQQRRNLDKPAAVAWLRERGHLAAPDVAPQHRRQVATYDYRDERGELLFQVVRFDPKDFRQRRPDGDGWTWKTAGVRRVLYRLPELIAAVKARQIVFVCEGEKAVDMLVSAGLEATCSPGGAGKWQAEYGAPLAGADVVILPDNDQPGRDHATSVTAALKGIVASVRVLELPGLPEKGDVADFLAAGGTWQQLEELSADVVLADLQHDPEFDPAVVAYLSAEAWAVREFPPSVRLLGDLVTTTSRIFLIGATGLGKTMLGVALGAGMASGQGFLDWRCDRPVRVLYVDGEMPGELVRQRVRDAMRRIGCTEMLGKLLIYARDSAEVFAGLFPRLGQLEPLNTEAGQSFVYALIRALGGVDVVIFDNVMSLVSGDQKDEVPWSETLPLVSGLTRRQIGQVWLDHAGHNTARQYGSSTKAWRFDAVGVMTELPEEERQPREMGFKLSFDAPGKARRRTPENWHEFAPRTIRLADDRWTSERPDEPDRRTGKPALGKVSPSRAVFHKALLDALISNSIAPGTTTLAAWESECIRRSLIEAPEPEEDSAGKRARTASFRAAKSHLVTAGWIGINDDRVSDLVGNYARL